MAASRYLTAGMSRPKVFHRAKETISWLQSTRQPQIRNLEDHAHDIEVVLDSGKRGIDKKRLTREHQVFQEGIHDLMLSWCKELDALRLEYDHLFHPLTEEEEKVFDDARDVASTLSW